MPTRKEIMHFLQKNRDYLKWNKWFCLLFPIVLAGYSEIANAAKIKVVTENSPPLQEMEGDRVGGVATKLVEAVLKKSGMSYEIKMYPWARAFSMLQEPNVLIYSMARTKTRESQFKWVGELLPVRYYLFRLKSRPEIAPKTIEEAKRYRIGVLRQDIVHQYLKREEFPLLDEVAKIELNFAKLFNNRVELVPYSDRLIINFDCINLNIDCEKLEPALLLEDISFGLYLAFSKKTDDAVVKKVRDAYDALKADGTYERIMSSVINQGK